eukprot:gene6029-6267_t
MLAKTSINKCIHSPFSAQTTRKLAVPFSFDNARNVRCNFKEEETSSSRTRSRGGTPYTGYNTTASGSTGYDYKYGSAYDNDEINAQLKQNWEDLKRRWNDWDPEERNITIGYSIGTLLVLYLANGLLNTIEPLPLLPGFLKLIGFSYSSWFFFRYLLFAEGREDLAKDFTIDKLTGRIANKTEELADRAAHTVGDALDEGQQRLEGYNRGSRNSTSNRLGSSGYSSGQLDSNIKSALHDIDRVADDLQ